VIPEYRVFRTFYNDETHAVVKAEELTDAACGAPPSYPTGEAGPSCARCREALGMPRGDVDPADTTTFGRRREEGQQQ
jgi:hypothetical protein